MVDEVCIVITFPSPPLRVPSPRRGLDADSGERGAGTGERDNDPLFRGGIKGGERNGEL